MSQPEWSPELLPADAPWKYLTERHAAKALEVEAKMLSGMRNHSGGKLRALQIQTPKGNPLWVYNLKDIQQIREAMGLPPLSNVASLGRGAR